MTKRQRAPDRSFPISKTQAAILSAIAHSKTSACAVSAATRLPIRTVEEDIALLTKKGWVTQNPLTLTPQGLVVAYEPVARAVAARAFERCRGRLPDGTEGRGPGGALEELQQEALAALCRATKTYDPSRLSPKGSPVSFATYARSFVKWAVFHKLNEDFCLPLPERENDRVEDSTPPPEVDPADQRKLQSFLSCLASLGEAAELHLATARALATDSSTEELLFNHWGLDPAEERADDPLLLGLLETVRQDLQWALADLAPDTSYTPRPTTPNHHHRPYQLPLPFPSQSFEQRPAPKHRRKRRRPTTTGEQLLLRGLRLGLLRVVNSTKRCAA